MQAKNQFLLFLAIAITLNAIAQERLKGNKIVITQSRDITEFTSMEIKGDFDVYIFQGTTPFVTVETDENLQKAVNATIEGETLKIELSERISKSTKLKIFVTITNKLTKIAAYKNANIYADTRIILKSLTINAFDNADFDMKIDADDFVINGFKNTDLKFNTFSKDLKTLVSESCELKLEGEIDSLSTEIKNNGVLSIKGNGLKLAIDAKNNGTFKGDDFKVENAKINANSRTNITVNVKDSIKINAEKNASISIYNEPAIEIEKLEGKAKIYKKKPFKLF
ncbi:MAG: DUF2807 domain-containing protein [Flavobacteriaceae bacterium]|jgi:hypothetical protein|nr:DUF2807 domain-containing protein [Flavobacteriaceae bacterium]